MPKLSGSMSLLAGKKPKMPQMNKGVARLALGSANKPKPLMGQKAASNILGVSPTSGGMGSGAVDSLIGRRQTKKQKY